MTSYIDKNRGRVSSLKRRGRRFYPSPVSYFLRICPPLRHSVNTRGINRESMPRVRYRLIYIIYISLIYSGNGSTIDTIDPRLWII